MRNINSLLTAATFTFFAICSYGVGNWSWKLKPECVLGLGWWYYDLSHFASQGGSGQVGELFHRR